MSVLIRARSRICDIISRRCNRRFSSSRVATEPSTEPIVSASTVLNNQPPTVDPPPPPPSPAPGVEKKSWNFLMYGLIAAVTGGVATAGYATYAYTVDEVDEKTKTLRAWTNHTVNKDASSFDKFQGLLYSSAMKVPATLVEFYLDMRRLAEDQVRGFAEPSSDKLLPDLHPLEQHVFTLVLDLNETLICTDWTRDRGWRTMKRPGVEAFLEQLARYYEIVVFTDLPSFSVDPIVERLDPQHCIRYRLSKVDTRYENGKHYRDFSKLNRDPAKIIYVSGHALDSSLQPENSVPIKPWTGEAEDTALVDLIPFLEYVAKARPADIRPVIASFQGRDIAKEFIERSKEQLRRAQEQKQHGRIWRR